MKSMTKGALAIGIGTAMLLGGGGTLARWNADANVQAGTIVTGDLGITAVPGVWTNAKKEVIRNINEYRVVPGETLTYTQKLTVALSGDQMKATLGLQGVPANTANMEFSTPKLVQKAVEISPADLTSSNNGDMTASATFTFKDTTTGQQDVNKRIDLSAVTYVLNQVAK